MHAHDCIVSVSLSAWFGTKKKVFAAALECAIARGEISMLGIGSSYHAITTEISGNFQPQTRLPGNSVSVAVKNSKLHDRRSSVLKGNHSDQGDLDYSTEWKS